MKTFHTFKHQLLNNPVVQYSLQSPSLIIPFLTFFFVVTVFFSVGVFILLNLTDVVLTFTPFILLPSVILNFIMISTLVIDYEEWKKEKGLS